MKLEQIIKNVGKSASTSVKKVGKAVAIGSIMAMPYLGNAQYFYKEDDPFSPKNDPNSYTNRVFKKLYEKDPEAWFKKYYGVFEEKFDKEPIDLKEFAIDSKCFAQRLVEAKKKYPWSSEFLDEKILKYSKLAKGTCAIELYAVPIISKRAKKQNKDQLNNLNCLDSFLVTSIKENKYFHKIFNKGRIIKDIKKFPSLTYLGNTRFNLGNVLESVGDYRNSLKKFRSAALIFDKKKYFKKKKLSLFRLEDIKELKNKLSKIDSVENKDEIYFNLGLFKKSKEYLTEGSNIKIYLDNICFPDKKTDEELNKTINFLESKIKKESNFFIRKRFKKNIIKLNKYLLNSDKFNIKRDALIRKNSYLSFNDCNRFKLLSDKDLIKQGYFNKKNEVNKINHKSIFNLSFDLESVLQKDKNYFFVSYNKNKILGQYEGVPELPKDLIGNLLYLDGKNKINLKLDKNYNLNKGFTVSYFAK